MCGCFGHRANEGRCSAPQLTATPVLSTGPTGQPVLPSVLADIDGLQEGVARVPLVAIKTFDTRAERRVDDGRCQGNGGEAVGPKDEVRPRHMCYIYIKYAAFRQV